MATVVDDQVAAQLNTRAAAAVQDFGAAIARGILRQSDGADELSRQTFVGLVVDNRYVHSANARLIGVAADPGVNLDTVGTRATKEAPAGWPAAGAPAAPGAPGGAGGSAAGKSA